MNYGVFLKCEVITTDNTDIYLKYLSQQIESTRTQAKKRPLASSDNQATKQQRSVDAMDM